MKTQREKTEAVIAEALKSPTIMPISDPEYTNEIMRKANALRVFVNHARDLAAKLDAVQAWADEHIPHIAIRDLVGMPYANKAIRAIIDEDIPAQGDAS